MNRRFNKPIRTYERKKFREVVILTPKINNSNDANNKNNALLNKNLNEESTDSMYDDPFETTFDRLLKNTRKLPPPASKTYNDTILVTSTDNDKSEINNHKSSLLEICNFDTKLISNQKIMHRKPKMRIVKKTIIKKKTSISQNSRKFKVCKDESQKKYELRKTRNNKILFKHLNVDCLSFNFNESKTPENKKCNQDKRKTSNKKYFVKKKRKDGNNMSRIKSSNNIEIKPCFVNLDRSIVTQWNNKLNVIENNLVKKNDKSLDQYSIINTNIDNFKSNNENMTCCSMKKEQLKVDSYAKPFNIEKKYKGIFSSTPNGKPIRPFVHLIPLSPISIKHLKKNKDSIMLANNSLINENNEVSSESKLITNDMYKNIDEKCIFEDKSKLLSNFNECNLNQLENVDKKNINLLTIFNYTTNKHEQKKESLTKIDSEQNISKNQTKQDESNKLITQEYKISNIKMDEYYLKFSIDENNSRSLFDSNESIQNILHDFPEENNIIKTSNNLVYDNDNEINEKNIKLNNEIHSNFVKLNEKSILNIDKEIIFSDKIWEELPTTSIPVTLNSSSDDVEFKLKTKEIEDKNNSILIEQTLLNENNISNKKYSSIDGNNTLSCHVVLKQLQDPFRITRRKKYSKWDLELIAEDCNNSIKVKEKSMNSRKEIKDRQISQKKLSTIENIIKESYDNECIEIKKPIYLKPGKSWARSLSILNNIQTEFNLEKLSIGKGKRWRDSVQDILNMQTQGIIQSCIKKNDSDKELQVTNEIINKSEHELVNKKSRTCDSTNFGRVSRRISVRVIPIHKTVKSIEDAPFLEVYGIVPVKSQRFTLLNNNPRKSSTCNFQHDDIDGQIIKEHVVLTAREVILQRCSQKDYISFSTYFSDLYLEYCRKIGEGVYGEVFLYEQENKKSVIKIIPIEGNDYVNGEPQKKFHEILSEIVIAMELHNLRFNARYNTDGFVEVKNIKCIKGKYPERLIELWNIYDEEKHSDNDCPSMFNDDQLYIVLELGHGGQDLEAFVFNTAEEAHILFLQAALALAVAEKAVEFEHRDLHWGNILISPTNETYVHFKIGQKNIELISKGVKVSIIDFTLSRIKYQGCSVFNDLASDPTLFSAQGEYQFEIYRLMRDKVKNNWQTFEPYTNILWLHYTLDKMITAVRYRKRNLKTHKNGITKLKELKNEILTYNSAFEFVTNCDKIVNLLRINPKSG